MQFTVILFLDNFYTILNLVLWPGQSKKAFRGMTYCVRDQEDKEKKLLYKKTW